MKPERELGAAARPPAGGTRSGRAACAGAGSPPPPPVYAGVTGVMTHRSPLAFVSPPTRARNASSRRRRGTTRSTPTPARTSAATTSAAGRAVDVDDQAAVAVRRHRADAVEPVQHRAARRPRRTRRTGRSASRRRSRRPARTPRSRPCASPPRGCRSARPRPAGGWRPAPPARRWRSGCSTRRISAICGGSSPSVGSSSTSSSGRPSMACAMASRCFMPWLYVLDLAVDRVAEAGDLQRLVEAGRPPPAARWPASTARRFSRPDRCGRKPGPSTSAPSRDSTGAPGTSRWPKTSISPRGRPGQPHQHPQRGGLAGAVRAEQADHLSALDGEVDRGHGDEPVGVLLAQPAHDERGVGVLGDHRRGRCGGAGGGATSDDRRRARARSRPSSAGQHVPPDHRRGWRSARR